MTNTTRLIVNTLAQHLRTVLNIALSLYSTRLAMDALGQSGYGVYMLIGGIVSLLLYITNSMIVTTQRHLSYSYGKGDAAHSGVIFQNSYLLHCAMGLAISALFLAMTPLLFNGRFLNIGEAVLPEARTVYYIVVAGVLTTFVTSPFRALLTARENIVYISMVDVLDGILKTALVCILYFITDYRLTVYAIILASVILFNFLALAIYSRVRYPEATLLPHPEAFSREVQGRLIGFATWTLYGTMCIFLRAQGIAVIVNRLYGAVMNAAYGIATQVFGSVIAVSAAIMNAITPQIIKSEGKSDRQRMLFLSMQACKYCFFLLALFAIPLVFEMDAILRLWLREPPENAALFCRVFIIAALCDQITTGLNASIQAQGRIRNYTLVLYTLKLLTVPAVWLMLSGQCTLAFAMSTYIILELLSAMVRLPYAHRQVGLSYKAFLRNVILRLPLPVIAMTLTCCAMCMLPDFLFRFLLTGTASLLVGTAAIWLWGIDAAEREYMAGAIRKKLGRA